VPATSYMRYAIGSINGRLSTVRTYAKLAAARALGLPVVMVRRPMLPEAPSVETVVEALQWLEQHHVSANST